MDEEVNKSLIHFVSGAIAGTAEHCGMFPVDTIKTHLQANKSGTLFNTTLDIWKKNGFGGYFRGITAVIWGAAPAHAIYFSCYEFMKRKLINYELNEKIAFSFAGICATLLSDAVLCPMDVVKQRRQLNIKQYRTTLQCAKSIIRNEGIKPLYSGYITTLTMNIPFNAIYFPVYEYSKKYYKKYFSDESEKISYIHTLAGGTAGIIASGVTNPLDVTRTRLQTQGDTGILYKGMVDCIKKIWIEEGMIGFMRGIVPRMVFNSLSAGICWTTYEYLKYILGAKD